MLYGLPAHAFERLIGLLRQDRRIHGIWLFGSRALGREKRGSDIDLCLDAPSFGISELAMLEAQIDDLLLPWKVDIVLLHQIDDPELLAHIERVGVDLSEDAVRSSGKEFRTR